MLISFVCDRRRIALARDFKKFFGPFGVQRIRKIKKMSTEEEVDVAFEEIEANCRSFLQEEVMDARAEHQRIVGPLEKTFQAMRDAAHGKLAKGVEIAHFAPARAAREAWEAAEGELRAFEADMAELHELEARLLRQSGGVRPVAKGQQQEVRKAS